MSVEAIDVRKQVLLKVRERLSIPDRWCKEENAKNTLDEKVACNSPSATCWCINGAISVESSAMVGPLYILLNDKIIKHTNNKYTSYMRFNDESEHDEVLAFLDKVIEEL